MLSVSGIAFYHAPFEKRAIFQFDDHKLTSAMVRIKRECRTRSVVILSTCDRVEVYCEEARGDLIEPLCRALGIPALAWKSYSYDHKGDEAIGYLFNLTAGLDSPLFGEDTIISQVEHASLLSRSCGCSSPYVQSLMGSAVSCAKKIHATISLDTPEEQLPPAMEKIIGEVSDKRLLVIGSSSKGRSVATYFQERGWQVAMTLRDERKTELVPSGVKATGYEERYGALPSYPVIVCATKGLGYALDRDAPVGKEQIVFDLARPYDVDPLLEGKCHLFRDGDLVYERKNRDSAIAQSRKIIEEKKELFFSWARREESHGRVNAMCEHAAQDLLYRLQGPLHALGLGEAQMADFSRQLSDLAFKSFVHELYGRAPSKAIDLSWPLESMDALYEGDPDILLHSYQNGEVTISSLALGSHSGTHMDAPRHLFPQGKSLDSYPIGRFQGKACVVTMESDFSTIGDDVTIVLFSTGWERKWGDASYLEGYPVLNTTQIEALLSKGIKMVGFDCPSPDEGNNLENHRLLLAHDVLILENLKGLESLVGECVTLTALPLLFKESDGAPVRVIANLS